ncbi:MULTISPECIES: YqgE/AlgH family protein [Chitinophagaceae]
MLGSILKSVSSGEEDYFNDTIVLVVKHNIDGTIGVVLNRRYGRKLTELEAFKAAPALDLFEGGPMQQDHLYFVHRISGIGGEIVNGDICFGGNFKTALSLIQNRKASNDDIKIFIGYCGWDVDQLEAELDDGAWEIVQSIIFE